ncbi:hypothetical protein PYCC9005_004242 [Savitreella phatthalungensis]
MSSKGNKDSRTTAQKLRNEDAKQVVKPLKERDVDRNGQESPAADRRAEREVEITGPAGGSTGAAVPKL